MATISVTGLASLDLSRLSLSALQNPANYSITEASANVLAFRVGTEFSYRLTGTNLFSLGAPGSTITSLSVTFGATSFNVSGINLDFFSLFQNILSGNAAGGFAAYLTGNDNVLGGDLADDIVDLVGHNNLFGGAGADTLTSGTGNDHLYGQSANGGSDGGDSISSGAGSDYINGNAGNDTISGGEGNDSLRGGQDNDTISGGAGADILSGDAGIDQLTGGDSADRFVFGTGTSAVGATVDTVTDFQQGSDLIALGFVPAAVLVGTGTAATIDAARTAAQALFDGAVGNQEVAAVALSGGSTLLFWSASGGATIDSAASFLGQTASDFGRVDFV